MKHLLVAFLFLISTVANAASVHSARYNLSTQKVVVIAGVIDEGMTSSVYIQMRLTANMSGPRLVIIRSPGGSVEEGMKIKKMLDDERDATHQKLVCVAVNGAHSMAFNIMTDCNVRLATPGTRMVAHRVAAGALDGENPRLSAKNLREIAKDMDKIDTYFDALNAKALHLTPDQYSRYADDQHAWTVPELVAVGYLNDVVSVGQ